jgi:hypothetical protein
MKYLIVLALFLTGCSSYRPLCPGTRYYDPQICRGEKWQQLPNFENEALIRHQRGERW